MDKHAAEAAIRVVNECVDRLEKQAAYIDELRAENEGYKRREGAAKLAAEAQNRGIGRPEGLDLPQLTAYFDKLAQTDPGRYAKYEGAMDLIGADMGSRLRIDDNNSEQHGTARGHEAWDNFVFGG